MALAKSHFFTKDSQRINTAGSRRPSIPLIRQSDSECFSLLLFADWRVNFGGSLYKRIREVGWLGSALMMAFILVIMRMSK